jgi:hypothetical protein
MLSTCLSKLGTVNAKDIERMVQDNYQDLLMVGSLTKLTQTHVFLAEKINSFLHNF